MHSAAASAGGPARAGAYVAEIIARAWVTQALKRSASASGTPMYPTSVSCPSSHLRTSALCSGRVNSVISSSTAFMSQVPPRTMEALHCCKSRKTRSKQLCVTRLISRRQIGVPGRKGPQRSIGTGVVWASTALPGSEPASARTATAATTLTTALFLIQARW
jgi:hypothetical protein